MRGVKASREMGARYMIFQEMLQEQREAGYVEGRVEGKAEGKAEDILDLLEDLPGEVPEEVRNAILSEKDAEILKCYLKQAAAAVSVEEFMQRISDTVQQ